MPIVDNVITFLEFFISNGALEQEDLDATNDDDAGDSERKNKVVALLATTMGCRVPDWCLYLRKLKA